MVLRQLSEEKLWGFLRLEATDAVAHPAPIGGECEDIQYE